MISSISVYGFGSFFNEEKKRPNDIDIVILYGDYSHYSAVLAIMLKNNMAARIQKIHVTMLSTSEENELNFISRSGSTLIYKADVKTASDVACLAETLCQMIDEI